MLSSASLLIISSSRLPKFTAAELETGGASWAQVNAMSEIPRTIPSGALVNKSAITVCLSVCLFVRGMSCHGSGSKEYLEGVSVCVYAADICFVVGLRTVWELTVNLFWFVYGATVLFEAAKTSGGNLACN